MPRWDFVSDSEYVERIKARCKIMPNGCWEWQGFRHKPPRNYGDTSYRGEKWRTHRLMFKLVKGEIPAGMIVMHACDNPPCCNPSHLRLGTHLDNMSECRAKDRYHYAKLTHCKHGHEFNEENTYYIKTPGKGFGLRACKACQRARQRIKNHGWPKELAYSLPAQPTGYIINPNHPDYRLPSTVDSPPPALLP